MKKIVINGEEPYQYSNERFREFDREVYVNKYQLVTGDSFEFGRGYSLHLTEREARKCHIDRGWVANSRASHVFVTNKTVEDILANEERYIFRSWEN